MAKINMGRVGVQVVLFLWTAFLLHMLYSARVADRRDRHAQTIAELTRSTAYMTYEGCLEDSLTPDEKVDCLLDMYDANMRARAELETLL